MRHVTRWAHMMSTTVSIAPRSGVDTYGAPSYGSDVVYQAHISRTRRTVINTQAQEVVSEQAVHLATTGSILPTARITLSTADVGSTDAALLTPLIHSVERRFDENGPHHTVIYL